MREAMHARGGLSGRHEALDLVSTLLLATCLDRLHGGEGFAGLDRVGLQRRVQALIDTHAAWSGTLPSGSVDFPLPLRVGDEALTADLIAALQPLEQAFDGLDAHAPPVFDVLNDVFGQVLADTFPDERQLGQYLTPHEVVDAAIELLIAQLSGDELDVLRSAPTGFGAVLDPSCGVGSFLTSFVHRMLTEVDRSGGNVHTWRQQVTSEVVVGFDRSARMIRLCLASLTLFGAEQVQLVQGNALARTAPFTQWDGQVGLVLSNPPFGAEYPADAVKGYAIADHVKRRVDSELLFIERYLQWLREGGRAACIVPDSVLANKRHYAALRDLVAKRAEITGVISLPSETFGVAGTQTRTSILTLRRTDRPKPHRTWYAVCRSIGYEVVTRSSIRVKVDTGEGDLPGIVRAYKSGGAAGRWVRNAAQSPRWDAGYHACLPLALQAVVDDPQAHVLRLGAIANVVDDRVDPRRGYGHAFDYVEIAGIDGETLGVRARVVERADAPGRARKRIRAGDILVSTVRPSRRTIGVVPEWLDGAVCSTGIAVVRPRPGLVGPIDPVDGAIEPWVLARLLRTPTCTSQLVRQSCGVSYPAFDEDVLASVVLPVAARDLPHLNRSGFALREAELEVMRQRDACDLALSDASRRWTAHLRAPGRFRDQESSRDPETA